MSGSFCSKPTTNNTKIWATLASIFLLFMASSAGAVVLKTQPSDRSINTGQTLSLSMTATSKKTISYIWLKEGRIVGRERTLNLSKVTQADAGYYSCKVTDADSSVLCKTFRLTVNGTSSSAKLKLVSQPSSTTVAEGKNITFSLNATSSKAINYIWLKEGRIVGNAKTLTITNAKASDTAYYSCKVADADSSVLCNSFKLTVQPSQQPAVTSNLQLTTQPSSTSAYEGKSVTFRMAATSSRAITYTWTRNGSVIGNGTSLTLSNLTTSNAGSYGCSASDGIKTLSCNGFTLTVNQIVRIMQQPANLAVTSGSRATMSVTATGTGPLSYQWYFNNSAISGATSSTLSVASAQTSQAGSYHVVVRNAGSTATSSKATLSVGAVAQTGSAMIRWSAPTTRADGSALPSNQISGYVLYHSATSASSLNQLASLKASELSIVVNDLLLGTHYFALATIDSKGVQSTLSAPISINIR